MVQTIATLIDETLMVMGAHLHVRMTDEEKAKGDKTKCDKLSYSA